MCQMFDPFSQEISHLELFVLLKGTDLWTAASPDAHTCILKVPQALLFIDASSTFRIGPLSC